MKLFGHNIIHTYIIHNRRRLCVCVCTRSWHGPQSLNDFPKKTFWQPLLRARTTVIVNVCWDLSEGILIVRCHNRISKVCTSIVRSFRNVEHTTIIFRRIVFTKQPMVGGLLELKSRVYVSSEHFPTLYVRCPMNMRRNEHWTFFGNVKLTF